MRLEVLVSCLNQTNLSIAEELNIKTDAVIVNQCNKWAYTESKQSGYTLKMIHVKQRGLTQSRNMALSYASGDICILCDDDVKYVDNYDEIILQAFTDLPQADIIVFNINRKNYNGDVAPIEKMKQAPFFKSYGSVRIAFRLKTIKKENIWFDFNFGAGSTHTSGEESLFLQQARKKGLSIWEHPAIIAEVDFSTSTWREGYNEKFFYDKGALLNAMYPRSRYLLQFYYVMRLRSSTSLSTTNMLKWMMRGMRGHKRLEQHSDYVNRNLL